MAAKSHTQRQKKHTLALLFCLIAIVIPTSNGSPDQKPEAVEAWFKNLSSAKERITKLHFYWHQPNCRRPPSSSASSLQSASPFQFGNSEITDYALRIGPEPTSKQVGRAQGLLAFADQNMVAMFKASNYVFTDREFNGSTLSVLGRNPVNHLYREIPIVGGTSVFRLARGIATLKTHSFNTTTGYVVVEYNIVVSHY